MSVIALTSGCPAGVGPELMVKAIVAVADDLPSGTQLRYFASPAGLREGARRAGVAVEVDGAVVVVGGHRVVCDVDDSDDVGAAVVAGVVSDDAVVAQRRSLLSAIDAAVREEVQAIVTAPVRKAALFVDGVQWPGQTELVHHALHLDDNGPPLMVFSGAPFILGLHTVHMALRDVSASLHVDGVFRSIRLLGEAARTLLGVDVARVAVLGVNPHAGEGGLFGDEELRVLRPAIMAVGADDDLDVVGPLPADGFFADVGRQRRQGLPHSVHAVLAMHHDQGLAPYKLLGDGNGVNITWGLRVPRTSPDHGTADQIAGKGVADPSSTIAAIRAALTLVARR